MKKVKFRSKNISEGIAIQKKLFSMGYKWPIDGQKILCPEAKYFYGSNRGFISYGLLEEVFKKDKSTEKKNGINFNFRDFLL